MEAATWSEALRRAELVAAGAALARRGLVRGSEGNLSCRLGDDRVLLTPRGADKGRLRGSALLLCRIGAPPPAEASTEAATHLAIYRADPAVAALVHAHPAALLALDAWGVIPDPGRLLEAQRFVVAIERVPDLEPGSVDLAAACREALGRSPVAVLSRHGALAAGRTIAEAMLRVEIVELLAAIELATLAGGPR